MWRSITQKTSRSNLTRWCLSPGEVRVWEAGSLEAPKASLLHRLGPCSRGRCRAAFGRFARKPVLQRLCLPEGVSEWPLPGAGGVGKAGFEPATSASRTQRAAKLRHFPWLLAYRPAAGGSKASIPSAYVSLPTPKRRCSTPVHEPDAGLQCAVATVPPAGTKGLGRSARLSKWEECER
jgi:hypothetical protein